MCVSLLPVRADLVTTPEQSHRQPPRLARLGNFEDEAGYDTALLSGRFVLGVRLKRYFAPCLIHTKCVLRLEAVGCGRVGFLHCISYD